MGETFEDLTAWCEPFQNGDEVRHSVSRFSEVGRGLVVDACP